MPTPANLVHETTTGTGTGNLTLANVNGKQSFSDAFGTTTSGTDVFDYFISSRSAAEWERGTGHMSDSTTLVRDTVLESTNSDAAVNFSAGTKDVTNDIPALEQTRITSETAQATTSGTAFDFTSLPTGIKRITVIIDGVSLSGTDNLLVQIGDSGGVETSGYTSSGILNAGEVSSSAGYIINSGVAAAQISGIMTLANISGNIWVAGYSTGESGGAPSAGGGRKELSATLDRVRLTRTGTNTFDAGLVNILYE